MNKNVIAVIDGAAGSCGKAKVCGEIATSENIGASVTNSMPNAGQTFVSEDGKKYLFKNIPTGIVNPNCDLFIGPGSEIDMDSFMQEYDAASPLLNHRKIYVHELVPVISNRHRKLELSNIKTGSTFKGSWGAYIEKALRDPALKFFDGYKNAVVVSNDEYLERLHSHLDRTDEFVLLEGSQGCDLSLNGSGNYPYTTGRDISVARMLSDSLLPVDSLYQSIMVIRPFPIKKIKGNSEIDNSNYYANGRPLTWSEINISSILQEYPYADYIEDRFGDVFPTNYKEFYFDESTDILTDESYNQALLNYNYIYDMYFKLPEEYKKQLESQGCDIEDLSIVDCLEIERLYHKSINSYLNRAELGESVLSRYADIPTDKLKVYYSNVLNMDIPDLSETISKGEQERSIYDLDINKLKTNIKINRPDGLYLNFFEQLDISLRNIDGRYDEYELNQYIKEYIDWLEDMTDTEVIALGTGERNNQSIKLRTLVK